MADRKQDLRCPLYEWYKDPDRPHRLFALDDSGSRGALRLEG